MKNLSKHGKTGGLMGFQRLIQGVYVCFRIFGGEGNADDTGGGALVKTQRRHHVAGLALVAGGARGDTDALGAQIGDDIFLNEFLNELGDGRNADVQLFGKLRERTLTIYCHMCDDISLEEVVLVRNTFQIVILLPAEKFG